MGYQFFIIKLRDEVTRMTTSLFNTLNMRASVAAPTWMNMLTDDVLRTGGGGGRMHLYYRSSTVLRKKPTGRGLLRTLFFYQYFLAEAIPKAASPAPSKL